jgi:uncharacterized delta-60 repeat protein
MVFGLLGVTIAFAASGDLDTTFSGDGLAITNFGSSGREDRIQDIALQSNGKIVAAGFSRTSLPETDFALSRYNPNGTLDALFGKRLTDFGARDAARAVAVQPDGKIILAGETCGATSCDLALARYNSDGSLDATFSGDGKQVTDIGGGDNGSFGIAIQSNGKIVVAGYTEIGGNYDFAVYRFNAICPDDSQCLDTTFSVDGVISFEFGPGRQDLAYAVAVQGGKITVIGYSGDAIGNNNNFAIARLNGNGTLDTTFSGDGLKMTDFGGDEIANSLALQPDGKIVVVGQKINFTSGLYAFAIARYNPDGSLDNTFGQLLLTGNRTGKRVFSIIAAVRSIAYDVVVQPDGKIVVAGDTDDGSGPTDFALARLKPNGSFDLTFGGGGRVVVDFGGSDSAFALARQPSDGKYVLGGLTTINGDLDFALVRVLP